MPYKDPEVAKQKARERYALLKDDPDFKQKCRDRAAIKKNDKRLYDAARRQSLPANYRTAVNQRYWQKLKEDPDRKAKSYANAQKHRTTNHQAMLRHRLSERIRHAMRDENLKKSHQTVELLGASIPVVLRLIESKFKAGMSWGNNDLWEIDHIKAVSKFDLTLKEERLKAFHYTNLQPLWREENRQKSNRDFWIDPYTKYEYLNGVSELFVEHA